MLPGTAPPPDKVYKHMLAGGRIAAESDFGAALYDSLKAYDTNNDQTWSVGELVPRSCCQTPVVRTLVIHSC